MGTIHEELPGDLKRIAEVAGLEAAIRIGMAFRGTYLYIHTLDSLKRLIRDEEIRRGYARGEKVRELSKRFGLAERTIKKILARAGYDIPEGLSNLLSN